MCDSYKWVSDEQKNLCYVHTAIATKDISLCDKMIPPGSPIVYFSIEQTCYQPVAIAAQDESMCKKLPLGEFRDTCVAKVREVKAIAQ
jgi:hypothetical protein